MAKAWIIQPLPIAAAAANRTVLGSPLNVANDYAGLIWQTAVLEQYEEITIDLGSNRIVDTALLLGIGTSSTPSMEVAAAKDGDANFAGPLYTSAIQYVLAGTSMPVSGKGVGIWDSGTTPPGAYRYWRFRFFAFAAAYELFAIARIVLGKRIRLERNFSFGGSFGVRDLGNLDFSARGVLLRRRAKKLRTVALTFSNVRKDEVEATTKPLLEQIGNTEMIALVTDPTPGAQLMNRCYYGPLVGDLGHTWRNAAAWEAKINLVSIF